MPNNNEQQTIQLPHPDLISIIVPVFKAEHLDSHIAQDYDNIEILCINDASPDNSSSILRQYAQKDSRIKVFDFPENHGVGFIRNFAIDKAQGEYIGFVDSDDWIAPAMFKELLSCIKNEKSEIAYCNYFNTTSNKTEQINQPHAENWTKNFFPHGIPFLWQGLYTKKLFTYTQLSFPPLRTGEDMAVVIPIYIYSKTAYCNQPLYYHRRDNTSITRSPNPFYFLDTIQGYKLAVSSTKLLIADNKEVEKTLDNILIHVYLLSFFDIFVRFTIAPTRYIPPLRQEFKQSYPAYKKSEPWKARNLKQKFLLNLLSKEVPSGSSFTSN